MRLNTQLARQGSPWLSLGDNPVTGWQWQPTLTAHDPDPPIPLTEVVAAEVSAPGGSSIIIMG